MLARVMLVHYLSVQIRKKPLGGGFLRITERFSGGAKGPCNQGLNTLDCTHVARSVRLFIGKTSLMEVNMKTCSWPKAVHVNPYWRFKNGRWERVCEHCRSHPA